MKDKNVIKNIAKAVTEGMDKLLDAKKAELSEQYVASKRKMITFFTNAPVIVTVFMTHLEYYDPIVTEALRDQGYSHEEMMKFFAYPDVLSIGAAIQNLLLAAHEKGYGACWMNEPAIAGEEISKILNVPPQHKFISLIPIGYPAYTPRGKELKAMDEVLTIV